jgi:hypothetical protein
VDLSILRRKRTKGQGQEEMGRKEKHYTLEEVKATLALATQEAAGADARTRFQKKRLRALVYFVASQQRVGPYVVVRA